MARQIDPSKQAGREFYARVWSVCQQALEQLGSEPTMLRIGGRVFRFVSAGSEPLVLLRAFGHLEIVEKEEPDFTVYLWDQASSHLDLPPLGADPSEPMIRGRIPSLCDASFITNLHKDSGVLSLIDLENREAICCLESAKTLPEYALASPLRAILDEFLTVDGRCLMHAAAVGSNGRAVLLVGKGGSGKSSTAIAALLSGMDCLGDDYVVLSTDETMPRVHSLYCLAKVAHHPRFEVFPDLGLPAHTEEKQVVDLCQLRPSQLTRESTLVAILLPTIADSAKTCSEPVSKAQALRSLAPSTMFQSASDCRYIFQFTATLLSRVPTYSLQLGSDLTTIAPEIRRLMGEIE